MTQTTKTNAYQFAISRLSDTSGCDVWTALDNLGLWPLEEGEDTFTFADGSEMTRDEGLEVQKIAGNDHMQASEKLSEMTKYANYRFA